MKLPRKKRPGFAELTVASDLAFLLIIFFILVAGFDSGTAILLSLPDPAPPRLVPPEEILRFAMTADGTIVHGGSPVGAGEAAAIIALAIAANPSVAVALAVDPLAAWQGVVSFVETAQELDVEAFSFSLSGSGGSGGS